jgi:hypothetical protein
MKTLRIFPRITNATPIDENVVINRNPGFFDEADYIKISVTFTWDLPIAEKLYRQWRHVGNCEIGGPALGSVSGEFIPGMFLKNGYVITSRGCKNKCWFCSVWKREPDIKELEIKSGWIIQDDNLLGCSDQHIKSVFEMLKKQNNPIQFTGGIEAKLLKPWHIELFDSINIKQLFCAYDTPDDLEPLVQAGKLLSEVNITMQNRKARCYVLIGYPGDTFEKSLVRMKQTVKAGFFPFAMLWRNEKGVANNAWKKFQREWANPIITASNVKLLN